MHDGLILAGRVLLACFFVVEGWDKVARFDQWVAFVADAGLPAARVWMAVVVLLLAVGSALLLVGYRVRLGVALLLTFLVPTILLFESSGGAIRGVSIAGGLLLVLASGAGRFRLGDRADDGARLSG